MVTEAPGAADDTERRLIVGWEDCATAINGAITKAKITKIDLYIFICFIFYTNYFIICELHHKTNVFFFNSTIYHQP